MRRNGENQGSASGRATRWGLVGAVAGALAASACCLGPLLLVMMGATGAWIGGLSALEPYRPLFVATTLGLLGFAFFREYRKPATDACAPGSVCAVPAARRGMRVALWVVAALVGLLLVLPYAAPRLVPSATAASAPEQIASVTLAVHNMTCSGCVATVTKALTGVPGVAGAEVTLEPPRAVVRFDSTRVTTEQLTEATGAVGYPAEVLAGRRGRQ
jgi:mercuric ion transport protein